MTRLQIEKAMYDYDTKTLWTFTQGEAVDFAIEQVNAALEEAAALIDGVGKAEHNDAEKIRALKVKP